MFSPLPLDYQRLRDGCTAIELSFNSFSYYPIVSTLTGALRQLFGLIQVVSSITYVIFNMFRIALAPSAQQGELIQETVQVLEFAMHGIYNVVRAQFEMIPFINFMCILYDRVAQFRISYSKNEEPSSQNSGRKRSLNFTNGAAYASSTTV